MPIHATASASASGAPAPGTTAISKPITPPMTSRTAASRGKTRARTLGACGTRIDKRLSM